MLLNGKGYKEVINLKGGIKAWQDPKAKGPQELSMELISGEESPREMLAVAYALEDGLGYFYHLALTKVSEPDIAALLQKLSDFEEKHKQSLVDLFGELYPDEDGLAALQGDAQPTVMEGGFKVEEFLAANEAFLNNKTELLSLAMMLETQAMDLYMRFAQQSKNETTQKVLHRVAEEEKFHLASLGKLIESTV
jgi:rubrerythrin